VSVLPSLEPPYCVEALFDFNAIQENQISFREGELLELLVEDRGWAVARNVQGSAGFVPLNYLRKGSCHKCAASKLVSPSAEEELRRRLGAYEVQNRDYQREIFRLEQLLFAQQQQAAGSSEAQPPAAHDYYFYRAIYDFASTKPGQLSFRQAAELKLLRQDHSGWWLARDSMGCEGLIPANYVQLSCKGAVTLGDDEDCLLLPSGCVVALNNSIRYPDGCTRDETGITRFAETEIQILDRDVLPDGCVLLENGCFRYPSGAESTTDGRIRRGDELFDPPWQLS